MQHTTLRATGIPSSQHLMFALLGYLLCEAVAGGSTSPPKHFVVALVDDLGGYNVPWRNPLQKMAEDLVQLSTVEGMTLENFYTYVACLCV